MKRFLSILAAVVIALVVATSVLAASLGISPSHVEVNVPSNGSATANFQVHYFSGDLKISLVDIPLRLEPETLHIEPSGEPVDIELTIYGDDSLGSQVYNGYINFLGMTGETVAVAINVRAKITNIVEGQPVPEEPSPEETPPPEEAPPEQSPPEAKTIEAAPPEAAPLPPTPQGGIGGLPLTTVIIIAGGLVFLGLVALAISLAVRRRY